VAFFTALVVMGSALSLLAGPAGATARGGSDDGGDADPAASGSAGKVLVINVSGLIDPVLASFIEQSIEQAEGMDAKALVLQLNSEGTVLSDEQFTELARSMVDADVPVDVWVGPSGAKAFGGAAELVAIADVSGMAPGTRLGNMGEQRLPEDEFGVLFGENNGGLTDDHVDEEEALDRGFISEFAPIVVERDGERVEIRGAPTVGDFIVNLDGVVTREIEIDGQPRRQPVTVVLFSRLSILDQLAHTVASPEVAYLLLALGFGLLVFELYTAGIGIAGVVGAVSVVSACYGLWVLPTNWWAVALIALAFFGFAVDVQTGVPRAWTVIGVLAFAVGTFTLYDGLTMSWVTVAAGIVGVLLAFLAGMPAMVRTRFSTPTIGRDWMIGEMGEAVVDLRPGGVVRLRDALWRAETNRATPIAAGDPVRVVAIDGLLLEVEPEEGGARDYREGRRSRTRPAGEGELGVIGE
jgi:membrane-bound serine protease (ClpP class)